MSAKTAATRRKARLTIAVDRKLVRRVREIAAKQNRSLTAFVVDCLRELVEASKRTKKHGELHK
jgi:predicted transcriptional regulator